MYTPSPELRDFVQSLPKTETHLHLEGACPLELFQSALAMDLNFTNEELARIAANGFAAVNKPHR